MNFIKTTKEILAGSAGFIALLFIQTVLWAESLYRISNGHIISINDLINNLFVSWLIVDIWFIFVLALRILNKLGILKRLELRLNKKTKLWLKR